MTRRSQPNAKAWDRYPSPLHTWGGGMWHVVRCHTPPHVCQMPRRGTDTPRHCGRGRVTPGAESRQGQSHARGVVVKWKACAGLRIQGPICHPICIPNPRHCIHGGGYVHVVTLFVSLTLVRAENLPRSPIRIRVVAENRMTIIIMGRHYGSDSDSDSDSGSRSG